jgi:DNA-binding transcriptional ArsR family regulator
VAAHAIVTVFSALADETRLDIVTRLAIGDATLSELAEHYDMSIQAGMRPGNFSHVIRGSGQ